MQRTTITSLLLVGMVAASCQPIALTTPESSSSAAARVLPAVSSGPPAMQATAATTHSAKQDVFDPDVRGVLDFLSSRHTGLSQRGQRQLAETVVAEAREHDLDPALVAAVIQVESGGYHMAVSSVGALGLMQLLPTTAEEVAIDLEEDWRGPDSLFDPVMNVKLGVSYLKRLNDRYGSIEIALAAYNWGPARVDRRIRNGSGVPSIYVKQVMRAYESADARRS